MSHIPAFSAALGGFSSVVVAVARGLNFWFALGLLAACFLIWAGAVVVLRHNGPEVRAANLGKALADSGMASADVALVLTKWAPRHRSE